MLDLTKEAQRVMDFYKSDPRTETFNAVIYGPLGVGKSWILRTCRHPVLVHSFDPGGQKTNRDVVKDGWFMVDSRFEMETPKAPKVMELWDKEYEYLKKIGFFNHLGTFVLDSGTTWAQCIMYWVLKKAGRSGGTPFQQDWLPQMNIMENALRDILSLPCDFIFIGHEASSKDEGTGRMFISLDITGKLKVRVPLLFDEIYHAQAKETSKGVERQLLTQSTGLFTARSRLSKGGAIDQYEEMNIKKILKKAGLPHEDKPNLIKEE